MSSFTVTGSSRSDLVKLSILGTSLHISFARTISGPLPVSVSISLHDTTVKIRTQRIMVRDIPLIVTSQKVDFKIINPKAAEVHKPWPLCIEANEFKHCLGKSTLLILSRKQERIVYVC